MNAQIYGLLVTIALFGALVLLWQLFRLCNYYRRELAAALTRVKRVMELLHEYGAVNEQLSKDNATLRGALECKRRGEWLAGREP